MNIFRVGDLRGVLSGPPCSICSFSVTQGTGLNTSFAEFSKERAVLEGKISDLSQSLSALEGKMGEMRLEMDRKEWEAEEQGNLKAAKLATWQTQCFS